MPRMKQISAAQERDELLAALKSASFLLVRTRFLVHERQETQAMADFRPAAASSKEEATVAEEYAALAALEGVEPCPCCGSLSARLVETIEDLQVLISVDTKERWNRWENITPEDDARFDAMAAEAKPYGTELATVWEVPIDFTCSREAMGQIQDDRTRCIYWSGGWRSSKSHTAAQWWLRGWVLHGSRGELFWLVGPELKVAFRLMERLFLGRGETDGRGWQRGRSVAPKHFDPDLKTWRSQIAKALPAHEKVSLMQFEMVDGSVIELRHTKSVTALEGDTVRRVLYDEAIRSTGPEGYEILLSRVQQGGGQLGIASIPGEDGKGWWLYERVVQPASSGVADKRMHCTSSYANLWSPHYEVRAGEESQGDDDELVQRVIFGLWSKAGGTAYGTDWQPETCAPMHVLDAHLPASWGYEYDVTEQVAIALFGPKARGIEYLGSRDWNWTQVGPIAKVFGNSRTDRSTWAIVFVDEHMCRGDAARAAMDFTERFRGGFYAGKIGLVVDANGFWAGHEYRGKRSESTDAYEFERVGCLVQPPMRTGRKRQTKRGGKGLQPANPGVAESKKLVRRLMRELRIKTDGQVCRNLTTAIPQVKAGEKRARDAGTTYDKTIACWDDCVRYIAWAIFSSEQPHPAKVKAAYRTNAPVL